MRHLTLFSLAATVLALTSNASANMQIKFVESAPKDWFAVTNNSDCSLNNIKLTFDLTQSQGALIFDTTAAGAGVEVYQPFSVRSGNLELVSGDDVADGDKTLTIMITDLRPTEVASFTIDVDDTLTKSELGNIRVSRSEIAGAKVSLADSDITSTFDDSGATQMKFDQCAK